MISSEHPAGRRSVTIWDLWPLAARSVCITGLVGGVIFWGVAGMSGTALALTILCWWLLFMCGFKGRRRARAARRLGLGLTGGIGLLIAAGLTGLVLLLLLAAFSPIAAFLLRGERWRLEDGLSSPAPQRMVSRLPASDGHDGGSRSQDHPDSAPLLPQGHQLSELDDTQLCYVWRHSFLLLSAGRDTESMLELVRLRGEYLDELTRRHPAQMARWLASGARAAGNPLPYFTR